MNPPNNIKNSPTKLNVPGNPKFDKINKKYKIENKGIKITKAHNKKVFVFYIYHIKHDTKK